ncbi:TonB-dependent siderophore receptor [Methylophaga sp.]|uniref:TonB-dependent siderophore receptor n=1 Tax=Methylophaga sp. TaxID=2024840 RepID=UPI003A918BA1
MKHKNLIYLNSLANLPLSLSSNSTSIRFILAGITLSWACSAVAENVAKNDSAKEESLPTVTVRGLADATTEGSGSYTSPVLTIGSKAAVPVMEIPNSVSVITRQRIEDQNLVRVEEALAQVTGVTVTPWDGATFQIRSRGYFLEPSYDGLPAFGGLNATQQFDIAMFDRVEVLRGPAGLFQGSGQPGGTVNFVRKRAPSEAQGSMSLTHGSWSNNRAEFDAGAPLNKDGSLRGRFVATIQDREFYYDDANSRKKFLYGTLDYDLTSSTTFSLHFASQDDKTTPFSGLPTYTDGRLIDTSRSTNLMPSWAQSDTRNQTIGVEAAHSLNNGWLIKAVASHSTSDWYLNDAFPTTGVDPDNNLIANYRSRGWDDESSRDAVDLYATGPFSLFGRQHEATIGSNYERYSGETLYGANTNLSNIPLGSAELVPENNVKPYVSGSGYETRQNGIYSQLRLSVTEPLTLVLGGRLSNFTTRSRRVSPSIATPWDVRTRERDTFTPYAGVVYRINQQLALYTSYSDIFMPQSQMDVSGNTLEPREGKQIEFGIKADAYDGKLQLGASVFRTRDVNRAFNDLANPGFSISAGEVEVKGAELEISGSPTDNLDLMAGYAYLTSSYEVDRLNEGSKFSLFEPKHSLKFYGTYRFAGTPWRASAGMIANSAINGTGEKGVREGSGYAVFNAQLGYNISQNTSLTLALDNLTDRKYYERIGGLNSYNIYGEPRTVSLNLRTGF